MIEYYNIKIPFILILFILKAVTAKSSHDQQKVKHPSEIFATTLLVTAYKSCKYKLTPGQLNYEM